MFLGPSGIAGEPGSMRRGLEGGGSGDDSFGLA